MDEGRGEVAGRGVQWVHGDGLLLRAGTIMMGFGIYLDGVGLAKVFTLGDLRGTAVGVVGALVDAVGACVGSTLVEG